MLRNFKANKSDPHSAFITSAVIQHGANYSLLVGFKREPPLFGQKTTVLHQLREVTFALRLTAI